jgi:hypothetical protein
MSEGRSWGHAVCHIGRDIFVIGGKSDRNSNAVNTTVEVYDVLEERWRCGVGFPD